MARFENVLFLGAGGGNDVFSTVLAVDAMRRYGHTWDRCSIAGVLSPFHEHAGLERVAPGFYRTGSGASARPHRRNDRHDPFPDPVVARMVERESQLGIDAVYALDLGEGSLGVSRTLRELFLRGMFTFVVVVDIGGDILGMSRVTTMSPMFEAMVLRGAIDAGIPFWTFVAGLGADGETEPHELEHAINWIAPIRERLYPGSVELWEGLYRSYVAETSPSRTIPLAADIFRNWTLHPDREERFNVPGSPTGESYVQRIRTVNLLFFYLFVKPQDIKNCMAVPCVSPFDWFSTTQLQLHTQNEANHRCERLPDGDVRAYLTPYFRKDRFERRLPILASELDAFARGEFDSAWMFPEDWTRMAERAPKNLRHVTDSAGLSLIGRAA